MGVRDLAVYLADKIQEMRDNTGMAERATIAGASVVTNHGIYTYDAACPVLLYEGKQVWVQIAEDGTAVVIGD